MFTAEEVEKMLQIASKPMVMDSRRWKTSPEIAPNCPRCASSNTKFCYYNNYSLSQPRYFCKGCRRYWTRGGSLRNVPVGGGCRKNRRSKSTTRIPPPTDRVSDSRGKGNSTMIPTTTTTTTNTSSTAPAIDETSSIDLAVVFAKYFNGSQNSPFSLTPSSSSSSDLLQFPEEQAQTEQQKQGIDMGGFDDHFIGNYEFGLEDQANRINSHFMEFPDPNGYGLHPMLGDEFSQATDLWSESTAPATGLPYFSWQQTSEIQGLESLVSPLADHHHHLTFHPNVLINNQECCSSSFDLSGYGGISSSRPL